MDEAGKLETALKEKVITEARLERGTVFFRFSDGTTFEREKTYEGVITATLRSEDGTVLITARI